MTRTTALRRAYRPVLAASLAVALGLAVALSGQGRTVAASAGDGTRLDGVFTLSIGGLRAGEIVFEGVLEPGQYRVSARLGTAGMVRSFYEAGIEAEVEGATRGVDAVSAELAPALFRSESFDPEKRRKVEMRYSAGAPAVRAEPAYDERPWQLDPATQTGTLDPLSAVLTAFVPRPARALCDRSVRIFDARRLFAVTLEEASKPSEQGVIVCEAEYRRLGGFKPKMLAKPPFPFRVEFTERPDGLWQFDRAIGQTPVGTAVLARKKD